MAQTVSGIKAYFARDTVVTALGQVFDNHLIIENNTDRDLNFSLVKKDSFALIALPDNITVESHHTRSLYVQHLALPKLLESIGDHYQVAYQSNAGRVEAGYYLLSKTGSKLNLTAYNSTYFMDPNDEVLNVQLLCKNTGVKSIQFSFQVQSFPQGLLSVNQQRVYQLLPGAQQLVELTIRNGHQQTAAMDYYLEIRAIDLSGAGSIALSAQRIKVVQLGSNKRWDNAGYMDSRLMEHRLAFTYTQSGDNYSYNHILAEGNVALLGNDNLQYRLNYNGYFKPIAGNEIYDSYLQWQRPGFALKIGSINENMDYGLYGQGAVSTVDWNGSASLTALYVKRDYLIYSDLYTRLPQEKDFAVQYKWNPRQKRSTDSLQTKSDAHKKIRFLGPLEVHYIHGDDPLTSTVRHIISGQIVLRPDLNQRLSLEGGGSREYFEPAQGNNRHKDGWSAGFHYNGNWRRLSLSLDNYASSPYYSGLRRGSVLLSEMLSLNMNKGWLTNWQYNRQKNDPAFMDNYYAYSNPKTDRRQYGWAVSKNGRAWSIHFKPYYLEQSLDQQFMGHGVEFGSKAVRGELTLIKRGARSQLSLTSDAGWVNTQNPYVVDKSYGSWRLMGSYNYGILSVNGVLQDGPVYIMEEAAPWQYSGYQNYSIGPAVNWVTLRSALKLQASDYLNYNGFQKQWNHNLSVSGQYQISTDIQFQADAHLNIYTDKYYRDFVQFSVGVQKTFRRANGPGHHSWQIYFFKDLNANGSWDKGESALGGVVAQVKNVQVKSAVNGKAVLSDLPEGTYHLQLSDGKGWSMDKEVSIDLKRNAKTYIGLTECIAVKGKLIADTATYTGKRPNLEGIQIVVKEVYTGRVYTTYSSASGTFSFQLPKGDYRFAIPGESGAFSVQEKEISLKLAEDYPAVVVFHIKDRSRAVDIQEF